MWKRSPARRPGVVSMSDELWRGRLTELCAACIDDAARLAPARLRETYALFSMAPEDSVLRVGGGDDLPALPAFEAMMAAGAEESAALALLPQGASFLLSRGDDGLCLASVMLATTGEEVTAQGNSPALALLAALSASLLVNTRGEAPEALADFEGLILPEQHWLN